jgi:hypothetical protein
LDPIELMEDRSHNWHRQDELVNAAFWDLVAREVRRIKGSPVAAERPLSTMGASSARERWRNREPSDPDATHGAGRMEMEARAKPLANPR